MKLFRRLFFLLFYSSLIYGTGYWLTMTPERLHLDGKPPLLGKKAKYSLAGDWVEQAFAPAHWVDRQVRPAFWGFGPASLAK